MGRGAGKTANAATRSRAAEAAESLQARLAAGRPIFRLLSLDPQHNQISVLARQVDEGELDIDPPYQRGSVWGVERKRNLIRSLSMGLPIGSIYLNRRSWTEPEVVIDGKQRLLAVKDWLEDRLEVPGSWFPADHIKEGRGELIRFSDPTEEAQRGWKMQAGVQVYRTRLEGDDAEASEAALFELINFGGVRQGEWDADAQAADA